MLAALALVPASVRADAPVIPWAHPIDDDLGLTPAERELGITPEQLASLPSFWVGDMLFTPEGLGASTLAALGREPLHAEAYDAAPGVLYVAMDGVTLSPTCGNGEQANAALDCSPLVDSETTFPPYGNGSAQASTFQELQNYYEPFNLVLTSQRPPDWLPYTMAVIGGASNQGGGVCGVANVACDGLKRNHVSLTFPESCGGVSETAAQETSHNWGMEHVDDQSDLMYPFNNGGSKSFVDTCNDIDHSTGGAVTQCTYVHEVYCPAGGGEQQNSYQELLGVFGPREVDTVVPEITSISPADGSTFTPADTITITASVSENSNFLAAKWTWVEGPLPDGITEYTKCTNNVCNEDYGLTPGTDPNTVEWGFTNLSEAPLGTYTFQFEVLDAYANYATESITIEIVPEGSDSVTGPDTADSGESADSGDTADSGNAEDADTGEVDGTQGSTSLPGQDGGGEQQNSYQELLGVFGPREVDTVVPEITSILPADGSTFTPADTINITASVSENSNFLAAKWTWVEGPLPDGVTEYTKCTNNVCDLDYGLTPGTDPNTVEWGFTNLTDAP
ncbi:MAG: hypothetical protein IAG13_08695, partial [Deltaproteobacteria bacterium]|nr:hypothetical protein [Nannocystaceae bacterium]